MGPRANLPPSQTLRRPPSLLPLPPLPPPPPCRPGRGLVAEEGVRAVVVEARVLPPSCPWRRWVWAGRNGGKERGKDAPCAFCWKGEESE